MLAESRQLLLIRFINLISWNLNQAVLSIFPSYPFATQRILDAENLQKITPQLLEGRPNTYVYTKALAENIIASTCAGMTIAITRPAIVAPSQKEPTPGWVDSVHGPAGLSCLAGVGILQTVDWNYDIKSDVYPVDLLGNALIGAAWHMHATSQGQAKVFNITSTNMQPMKSGLFMEYARQASLQYPSIYLLRPPMRPPRQRPLPFVYTLEKFFYHVLFAHFVDFILKLAGREKM